MHESVPNIRASSIFTIRGRLLRIPASHSVAAASSSSTLQPPPPPLSNLPAKPNIRASASASLPRMIRLRFLESSRAPVSRSSVAASSSSTPQPPPPPLSNLLANPNIKASAPHPRMIHRRFLPSPGVPQLHRLLALLLILFGTSTAPPPPPPHRLPVPSPTLLRLLLLGSSSSATPPPPPLRRLPVLSPRLLAVD